MPSLPKLLFAAAAVWVAASPAWSQDAADPSDASETSDGGSAVAAAAAVSGLPAISVSAVEPRVLRERVIASGLVAAVEEVQVQPLVEGQPIDALLADVDRDQQLTLRLGQRRPLLRHAPAVSLLVGAALLALAALAVVGALTVWALLR